MMDFLMAVIYASSSLFIILDPLLSTPVFIYVTKGMTKPQVKKQAILAASVAGVLMYIFLFFNFVIFSFLGLDIASFQIAGGILLFLLGIQQTLGLHILDHEVHRNSAAGVVIGTPLLCGPGAITTVLIMARDYGILVPSIAIAISVFLTWMVLKFSRNICSILGRVTIEVIAKIMGMLVTAIAVKLIVQGILALI